ncbi:MAG: hypothetical protein AB1576_00970 [Bacillota bacterium]
MKEARPCPCGCTFRHRHGSYSRFVVVGLCDFRLAIPRLYCPWCHKTEAVLPGWLSRRSVYPACFRQAAVVNYLAGEGGYRPVAAEFHLNWELLWQWVDRLAHQAKDLLAQLTGLLLWYEPEGRAVTAWSGELRRGVDAYRAKTRDPGKRESLAAIGPLLTCAHQLWRVGTTAGLGWGEPDPVHLLGFLDSCVKALG